ncbi:hypothetical protein ACIQYS_02985 [Psychrobacillus sp. NPDC096426]|uniref:hypothetical protein n=1 Tax=Psychrobacillus sp. NPDC096426 TaxID=3364491 RepID=UPI00382A25C1
MLQTLSKVDIDIQSLENRKEKLDVTTPSLLLQTGWSPLIPFEKSMEDILNYQRENLL